MVEAPGSELARLRDLVRTLGEQREAESKLFNARFAQLKVDHFKVTVELPNVLKAHEAQRTQNKRLRGELERARVANKGLLMASRKVAEQNSQLRVQLAEAKRTLADIALIAGGNNG